MQVAEVVHLEEFGAESAAFAQQLRCDRQGRLQQLRLSVLINFMEACYIWGAIAHHQVRFLTMEDIVYGSHSLLGGDVSLQDGNAVDCGHFLQVYRDDLDVAARLRSLSFFI